MIEVIDVVINPEPDTIEARVVVGQDILEAIINIDSEVIDVTVSSEPDIIEVEVIDDSTTLTALVSGTRGYPGPSGADGDKEFTKIAQGNLSADRLVIPTSPTQIGYADNSNIGEVSQPVWLTLVAALDGDPAVVIAQGNVTEPSWNWIPGEPIFLGRTGFMTQTPPSKAAGDIFILQVASPYSAIDIFYNPRNPIIL